MKRITPKQLHVELLMDSMTVHNYQEDGLATAYEAFIKVYRLYHGRYLLSFLNRGIRVHESEDGSSEEVSMKLSSAIRFQRLTAGLRCLFDQSIVEGLILKRLHASPTSEYHVHLPSCLGIARMCDPGVVADRLVQDASGERLRFEDLGNLAFYTKANFRLEYCNACR